MIDVTIDASAWENERGFGRFTRCLVGALAARQSGFKYTLLFDKEPVRSVPEGVDVVVAGSEKSMSQASSGASARGGADFLTMARQASRLKPDLFFFPAVYSYYPILSRRPKIMCFHDTIPERFPDLIFPTRRNFRLWQAKCWLAKKQATRVMTISDASARDLERILNIPKRRIDIITEGADAGFKVIADKATLKATRAKWAIPNNAPVLVYVGGFNRHKNVIRLIEAMPNIWDKQPDTHLVIIGRSTGDRFWDNADELQAAATRQVRGSRQIVFTGEIDDSELAKLLSLSVALVFPSLWEGFGLPALEAMSCGTTVISSGRGSLSDVVGDAGLYFDPMSSDDLAAQTLRLLDDKTLQQELRRKAASQAAKFSWDQGAILAESSFRNALGIGQSAPS